MTAARAGWMVGVLLAIVYAITLAPGVTFWDAGEFIAAAHVVGIPHPPGTPIFVLLGRVWTILLGDVLGVARAMNLMSALSTALAGGLSAWIVARETRSTPGAVWGAATGGLCAGLALSVWANATETEVYAGSLLLVVLMLLAAQRSATHADGRAERWVLATAYLIAISPALHLSALVGAPAAIVLAARDTMDRWRLERVLILVGTLVSSAGVGRMSWLLAGVGAALVISSLAVRRADGSARRIAMPVTAIMLAALATSVLLVMLVRAGFDPPVNQGNPSTLTALADLVARRQYDVAPLWPRNAPIWIQAANFGQYADWQFAFTWGRGIFTTPARVMVTVVFAMLGIAGWRALRGDAPRLGLAMATLALCGSLGVVAYLNLKAGASIGYGFVPRNAHEARERDYFFVLAFWAWGVFAGYGAWSLIRARCLPSPLALGIALVPLAGNWTAVDRPRLKGAEAAHEVATVLLESAPRNAVLFVAGDNDTYPVWYLQAVEGIRPDVQAVTIPLLPADWYVAEVARRTGLSWPSGAHVPGAQWQHDERAALIAIAARRAGRPIAATGAVSAAVRAVLGSAWRLDGAVYVSDAPANGSSLAPSFTSNPAPRVAPLGERRGRHPQLPDDVGEMMIGVVNCGRVATLPPGPAPLRDSLEVRCNLR